MTTRMKDDLKVCVVCENLAILCLRDPDTYHEIYREHLWMAHHDPVRLITKEKEKVDG